MLVLLLVRGCMPSHALYSRLASLLFHDKLSMRRLSSTAFGNVHSSMVMRVLESLPSIAVDKLQGSNSASYAIAVLTGKQRHPYGTKQQKQYQKASDPDDEMQQYIQRSDWTRTHVAHVYRLMAARMQHDMLAGHHEIRQKYISFIMDVYAYFHAAPANEFRWDTIELRQDYACVVELVADALEQPVQFTWYHHSRRNAAAPSLSSPSVTRDTLSSECRSRLFEQLLAWCGYGPSSAAYTQHIQQHSMELLKRATTVSSHAYDSSADQLQAVLRQQTESVQKHGLMARWRLHCASQHALIRIDANTSVPPTTSPAAPSLVVPIRVTIWCAGRHMHTQDHLMVSASLRWCSG